MISTEYPPMKGGVGRYTDNLVKSLRKTGFDVYVVCDENGSGEFQEISSTNTNANNSEILLKIVNDLHPDLVHIQFEHGLYGLSMDLKNPNKISTNIDSFYDSCRVPIVTTFHSSYTFKQWMRRAKLRASAIQSKGRHIHFLASLSEYWRHLLNYYSFHRLNWQTFRKSRGSVVFSKYMANMVGGGNVIYHGAEPVIGGRGMPTKEESRRIFSLPQDRRIALAIGFKTVTKGWDIYSRKCRFLVDGL
jgi:glycosyltransferase involved in cell wall biosynthesis